MFISKKFFIEFLMANNNFLWQFYCCRQTNKCTICKKVEYLNEKCRKCHQNGEKLKRGRCGGYHHMNIHFSFVYFLLSSFLLSLANKLQIRIGDYIPHHSKFHFCKWLCFFFFSPSFLLLKKKKNFWGTSLLQAAYYLRFLNTIFFCF